MAERDLPPPGPAYADLGVRLEMLNGVEYRHAPSLIVTRWLPVRIYVGPDGTFSVPAFAIRRLDV